MKSVSGILLVVLSLALASTPCRAADPEPADGPDDRKVASWVDGSLSVGELRSWMLARGLVLTDLGPPDAAREAIVDLAVLVEFAESARRRGLDDDPGLRVSLELARLRDRTRALRRHLAETIEIPEDEIRGWIARKPQAFHRPRKLSLRQIYLPYEEGGPEAVLQRLEEIRRAVSQGGDFAEIAQRESESQTAAWGGRLGFVDPDDLPLPVREVVRDLAAGETSSPVEHGPGASVFLCESVREGTEPTRAELEEKFRTRLRSLRAEEAWDELSAALLEDARPVVDLQSTDAVLRTRSTRLARGDLELLARHRGRKLEELGPEAAEELLRDWALGTAAADRAEELGLHLDPASRARDRWNRVEELARMEWGLRLEEEPAKPEDGELLAFFESRRDRYRTPPRIRLQVLDFGRPDSREDLDRARGISARIAAGDLDFAQAARDHSIHGSATEGGVLPLRLRRNLVDWGPLGRRAIEGLSVGETTELLHLDSGLWLIRLLEEHPAAPRSFDEVRPRVAAEWSQVRLEELRREIRDRFRREADLRVQWPPPRTLRWTTAREVDHYGFHLHRASSPDGPFERRTSEPIPATGNAVEGASYSWADPDADPEATYYYYLESVSTDGRRRRSSPVRVSEGADFGVLEASSKQGLPEATVGGSAGSPKRP